jgi:putative ABC transport system permease protein
MSLITIFGSIDQGLIFGILSLGLYVAFRILDLPDLTVDGSFVTGLAVSGMFALNGHPYLGVLFAIIAGFFAGAFTGLLHTKFNIQPILAGILTMTALYSINLKIMGLKPSIIFYGKETVFSFMEGRFSISGIDVGKGVLLLIITLIITGLLYWFLQTQIGLSLRATGDNEVMVRSSSINSDSNGRGEVTQLVGRLRDCEIGSMGLDDSDSKARRSVLAAQLAGLLQCAMEYVVKAHNIKTYDKKH